METVWVAQMLDLTDKGFKAAIRNMFRKLKETMVKEFEKNIMKMTQQVGIAIKTTEFVKGPNGNSRFEKYNNKMKTLCYGINSRFEILEGISEFEDGSSRMLPTLKNKEKKFWKKINKFSDTCGTTSSIPTT